MGIFSKVFGSYSTRELARIEPLKKKVLDLDEEFKALSDAELKEKTNEFRERLEDGETLESMEAEALATVREAAFRVLGKKPFPVQIIGAIVLHQGRIAEMKTGEGKTLVACVASYLNALPGKGVHVVTVNDYLADEADVSGSSVAEATTRVACLLSFIRSLYEKHPVVVTKDGVAGNIWKEKQLYSILFERGELPLEKYITTRFSGGKLDPDL